MEPIIIQSDSCPHKKRQFEYIEYTQDAPAEEKTMWTHSRKVAISKSKKEASGEAKLATPWTPGLWNGRKMHFCCLSLWYFIEAKENQYKRLTIYISDKGTIYLVVKVVGKGFPGIRLIEFDFSVPIWFHYFLMIWP